MKFAPSVYHVDLTNPKKLGAAWTFRGLLSSKEKFVMPGANLKENFVCDERR